MKDQETRRMFIEMCALGVRYKDISKELGVGLRTMSYWSKAYSEEIAELRKIKLEEIYERHFMIKEYRLHAFARQLERISNELNDRDLKEVKTPALLRLFLSFCAAIRSETEPERLAIEVGPAKAMKRWEEIMLQVTETDEDIGEADALA